MRLRVLAAFLALASASLGTGCTYLTSFARPIVEPPPDAGPPEDAAESDGGALDADARPDAAADAGPPDVG